MFAGKVLNEKEAEVKLWWLSTTNVAIAGKVVGWAYRVKAYPAPAGGSLDGLIGLRLTLHLLAGRVAASNLQTYACLKHCMKLALCRQFVSHLSEARHEVHAHAHPRSCCPFSAGPLRGVFYEEFAHRKLQAGGRFEYRKLGATVGVESKTMELGPSVLREFNKIEEVGRFANGIYARPRQRNFPAVDALRKASFQSLSRIVEISCGAILSHCHLLLGE